MAAEGNTNVNNLVQTIVQHTAFREMINSILTVLIKNNHVYCFGQNPGAQGEYLTIQLL